MRISHANKGNTPWNKGRKHNPETIQLIRETTRIAMQDPKVKVRRLNKPAQTHSEETRVKIREKVRAGWERRRERLKVQNGCRIEWQNLIAEASRKGLVGEELQWDSYKVLDQQLEQEWLESVLIRKKLPRPSGCRRSPKSPEQRTKISAAIAAKWADPEYRERVYSGLSRYHGKSVGVGDKRRRREGGEERKMKNEGLEMREQEIRKMKRLQGQKKAAKAVETYGTSRAASDASLEVSRRIIAQAILSLQSINN